jgi:hypothetical protein
MGVAPLGTPLEPFHPWRDMFWKLGGGATAVIGVVVREQRLPAVVVVVVSVAGLTLLFCSHTPRVLGAC